MLCPEYFANTFFGIKDFGYLPQVSDWVQKIGGRGISLEVPEAARFKMRETGRAGGFRVGGSSTDGGFGKTQQGPTSKALPLH